MNLNEYTETILEIEKIKEKIIKHRIKCQYWQYNEPCKDCMFGSISGIIEPLIRYLQSKQ